MKYRIWNKKKNRFEKVEDIFIDGDGGFYFQEILSIIDPRSKEKKYMETERKVFPITKNYIGKHDLSGLEVIGNNFELKLLPIERKGNVRNQP